MQSAEKLAPDQIRISLKAGAFPNLAAGLRKLFPNSDIAERYPGIN
jgi:hypothetical protein